MKSISRAPSGAWVIDSTASKTPRAYRSIILAAPYHQTGISFSSEELLAHVPQQPYVHLHVTLLITHSSKPNSTYFNLDQQSGAPTTVLTTYEGVRQRGEPEPEFNSLTYHTSLRSHSSGIPLICRKIRRVYIRYILIPIDR